MSAVFLSYARADSQQALRLYNDLIGAGVDVWLDQESLLPGQLWRPAIEHAIRNSRYFIALLSNASVNRRGYVQKELVIALDVLDEFPNAEIFVIPARLDDCTPTHRKLTDIHWVDLHPDWDRGVAKILKAIGTSHPDPPPKAEETGREDAGQPPVSSSAQHPLAVRFGVQPQNVSSTNQPTATDRHGVAAVSRRSERGDPSTPPRLPLWVRAAMLRPSAYRRISEDPERGMKAFGCVVSLSLTLYLGTLLAGETIPLFIFYGPWLLWGLVAFAAFLAGRFLLRSEAEYATFLRVLGYPYTILSVGTAVLMPLVAFRVLGDDRLAFLALFIEVTAFLVANVIAMRAALTCQWFQAAGITLASWGIVVGALIGILS